jgi:putative transposase
VNRKRVYRLWRAEGLRVPRKQRKKRHLGYSANGCLRHRSRHKDHVWAWDFIHDRTQEGRALKWLSIIDEYTRECLALEVGHGLTAERVIEVLSELLAVRCVPRHVRSDNGPEFIAQAIRQWLGHGGCGYAVHRAWQSVGEWPRGIVSQPTARRTAGSRGVYQPGRGSGAEHYLATGV